MRRQTRLAAVLVVVVLALTGFSTSTSGGKSKGGGSSGGGCSNSKKSNSGYRHNDYDDDYDDNSSSGSSYGTPTPTASDAPAVRVIRCAQPGKGKRKAVTASLIELRSHEAGPQTYEVDVTFLDARGNTVDTAETTTTLDYGDVRDLTVRMESPGKVSRVQRCRVTARLL